jgi:hypothetical protein
MNASVEKTVMAICSVASSVTPSVAATATVASIATRSQTVRRSNQPPDSAATRTPRRPGRSDAPVDRAARTAMTM